MTHQVAHDGTGYQCFRVVNGIYRLDVGPRHATPAAANAYCDELDRAARSEALREDAPSSEPSVPAESHSPGSPRTLNFPAGCALTSATAGTTLALTPRRRGSPATSTALGGTAHDTDDGSRLA